jgi:putative membrane-bound dehydrogenase-like protein
MNLPQLITWTAFGLSLNLQAASIAAIDHPIPDMRVVEGYRVELVAMEPQVMDPVAIAWGFDGKLWVVEMADYPLGMNDAGEAGGRVRFLEDTNGDGHYDRSQIFLDGLSYPNGVTPWRKGVLITAAPDILYAEDQDGDGVADLKRVMYTGFKEGNQQLRVNGLRFGLDGWFYGANGLSHGQVHAAGSETTLNLTHKDFRIHPDTLRIEAIEGATQFGRHRDDVGNWFGCDNSRLAFHFVLADRYVLQNPHLSYEPPYKQMRMERNPPVYPYSVLQKRIHADYMGNRFTSICGTMVYRDRILFDEPTLLACEPVHNCITRRRILPDGSTYDFKRVETELEREFMGSTNHLFRPVQLQNGPDGGLYVVDMHRAIVEHPHWVPKEIRDTWEKEADLRAGHKQGRIYRIVREDQPLRRVPDLVKASPEELNGWMLRHDNGWVRDAIHQHLLEQPALVREVQLASANEAPGIIHALHLRHALGQLQSAHVHQAITHPNPMVRRHAIRLAETVDPELIFNHIDEKDPTVCLQLALSLSVLPPDPRAKHLFAHLVHTEDAYTLKALACCLAVQDVYTADMPETLVAALFQTLAGKQDFDRLKSLPKVFLKRPADGTYTAGQWRNAALYRTLLKGKDDFTALADMEQTSLKVFNASDLDADTRAAAITFLQAWTDRPWKTELELIALLDSPAEPSIKLAVIEMLNTNAKPETAERLMQSWRKYDPDLRASLIDRMIRKTPWTLVFLKAVEDGIASRHEVSAAQRRRLTSSGQAEIKARSNALFGTLETQRAPVIEAYQDVLALTGNAKNGPAVFKKICAACHRMDDVGIELGPNLRSLSDRSPQGLLIAIIDPSRNVEPRYLMYECKLTNGESRYGLLVAQSDHGVELQGTDGKTEQLAHKDVAELVPLEASLMPIGLEATMSKQDLADLIAYLGYQP